MLESPNLVWHRPGKPAGASPCVFKSRLQRLVTIVRTNKKFYNKKYFKRGSSIAWSSIPAWGAGDPSSNLGCPIKVFE